MSGGAGPLVPTFHGFVSSSMDGLVLFEACLSGKLHHVPRRPHDRERANLIKSGSIFIYEENASGIKRWTDGVAWSPSRILGNFLIYRELEKPLPPGEKKRAMKRKRQSMPGEPYPRRDSDEQEAPQQAAPLTPPAPVGGEVKPEAPSSEHDKDLERQLIGSLVDSYGFRPDGLVKKTMSISINGISHHMVSYYKVDDVKSGILPRPLTDPRMTNISVRPELYLKQNFRAPVEETEHYAIDGHMHAHPQMMYGGMQGGYAVRPGQYFGGQHYPAMYGIASTASNPYAPMTETAGWGAHQPASSTMAYASNPAYAGQTYESYYGRNPSHPGSAVKAEEQTPTSQPTSYHSQYVPPYQGMQNGSQRTPSVMGSSYHTPVQQQPSTFSAMPGRPQYGASTMPSPSTNGSAQPGYPNPSAQQYAVRSPTQQSYSMQPQPARNGTPAIKSDHSATPVPSMSAPDSHAHLQQTAPVGYRSSSYAVGGAPPPTDLGSMVMSSSASYPHQQPPPPHSQHYAQYGSSVPQTFRATGELSSQAGSHYAH